jgi:putative molybdopterin biosynthesis protein
MKKLQISQGRRQLMVGRAYRSILANSLTPGVSSGIVSGVASPVDDAVARGREPALALPLCDIAPDDALRTWLGELARAGGIGCFDPAAVERLPLLLAAGRTSAEVVRAAQADPISRCAAMDGVALCAAETASATADQPVRLGPGLFEVVNTGQAVPSRWDAIVPNEELDRVGGDVVLRAPVDSGTHVRRAGENVEQGAPIIAAGRRLTAYDLAVAAACGHGELAVHRSPRVVVIPTGDEIRPVGSELAPGEAIDSSSTMLAVLLREMGADVTITQIARDSGSLLVDQLRSSCCDADLVLVIAGSARGTRDRTATVIASLGSVVVRGVSLRPAHPVILGRVGGVGVVGMPGYPMSTAFAFERFVRPLVELLSGRSAVATPVRLPVRLTSSISGRLDAEVQVPVELRSVPGDVPAAEPGSRRGSALASLARAHAVVSLPAGAGIVDAGEIVTAELLPASRSR